MSTCRLQNKHKHWQMEDRLASVRSDEQAASSLRQLEIDILQDRFLPLAESKAQPVAVYCQ